ncbi:MAG: dienelactone hydrolase family protein [Planctomycetaceae bacterium]|nr:dienelactone hydrolase family protein [Planctomycetaceae bacterium]
MPESSSLLIDGLDQASFTLILAHGAGSGMDTDFMNTVAAGIANNGFRVVRFEFPYMVKRRETGQKRPPDREPILRETWFNVIEQVKTEKFVVGGKSMGGRIASLVADEVGATGLVCLGYPFHPTGNPDKLRIEHLKSISTPTLILQGERDPFGNDDEVMGYDLSSQVQIHWLPDGDHSFKPRKRSGRSWEDNLEESVEVVTDFLNNL